MGKKAEKIYVVGHKNPDTDSICSAIAYADLKRKKTGEDYVARRAGRINEETHYVLKKFQVEEPPLLANVKLQVKDMDIHKIDGVETNVSIKDTWAKMKEYNVKTIPVLKDGELAGVISTGDIATSYMNVDDGRKLSEAKTQYKNIIRTLDGVLVTGNEHGYFTKGKVTIGASNPDLMAEFIEKDDLVILGNRREAQECAVDIDASCLVICQNAEVSDELIQKAEEQSIVIIRTPYDTFTTARLINQSIPVKHFMTKMPLVTFRMSDYVDDIKEVMAKKKFRDFPILDRHGRFKGFISRRRFLDVSKKKVILVDHNEKSQAVDGIEEADIREIIDHHRLGSIETMGPVFFRNQPVGCTATIVSQMYEEEGIAIDPTIAGLLCSAIISDTLLFRSPTCTKVDEKAAKKLAAIAGLNMEKMAQEMFKAGSNLSGKTAEEICFQDFKQFAVNGITFGVGQINSMNKEELTDLSDILLPYLPEVLENHKLQMVYFMLTDILSESTELLCVGIGAKEYAMEAFDVREDTDKLILEDVVSRKKQLIPALVGVMHQ
ncbi:putative manganese-dependent inorganic diphosphatase [Suipraeoptans intestinalis]|uniref:putative manganese-dependent inorganic diphosphatase n=1 Tax=Suipraeoptans intestinalis TaxID=2606628 RepID=UPI0023F4A5D4|nr:putative manganese-dependent inorganic diphosphatase [Suipraeoptans intestinalis]MDD7769511.1 putative manganese-dependent inorganic diphosphatase [Suipraeoptans intestinalis]MDY3121808.1 putative manganese-dependent inorganic diphosphatase [Suipraeoptans intestinalis]